MSALLDVALPTLQFMRHAIKELFLRPRHSIIVLRERGSMRGLAIWVGSYTRQLY